MGAESRLIDSRLSRGCRCFIGLEGGSVAAYAWLSNQAEWIGEVGLEVRCAPGEAYVWNCVTLPGFRLRGWFRTLLGFVVCRAGDEGLLRLWIASVGGAEKAVVEQGFVPAVRVDKRAIGAVNRLLVQRPVDADKELFAAGCTALGFRSGSALRWARSRTH